MNEKRETTEPQNHKTKNISLAHSELQEMKYRLLILLSTTFIILSTTTAQQGYVITTAPFNTDRYDEFAPVWYKDGIVFCTNRSTGATSYSTSDNKSFYKLFKADTSIAGKWHSPKLFSKMIRTKLNDGPATFSSGFDTIYFSRNIITDDRIRNIAPSRNKLGIFYSVYEGNEWAKIKELRFNSEWFNITMPCLSPDGKRLYFVSDRPDSYGGSDIYFSQIRNGYWEDPVNLGPLVNTKGNESYPFMNELGELFFSSDGHPGLGGKDIFVTKQRGDSWYPPVRLDEPVNSEYDDFGIVTVPSRDEGFFSSNRGKSMDIYNFRSEFPHIWFSEPQKNNQYCFTISDTGSIITDTLKLQYVWDFGDDSKMYGTDVRHCFPGPGKYRINLDLNDKRTGKLFFRKLTYDIELIDHDQPYITSPDHALAGESLGFDGLNSFCPGYNIVGYYWDFGDGNQRTGDRLVHQYKESGEYFVRMGLVLADSAKGNIVKRAVTKKINIFGTEEERTSFINSLPFIDNDLTDIRQFENVIIDAYYSAEIDIRKEAVFQVEILSSPSRLPLNSNVFLNVPSKYRVKETYDSATGIWSYFVDRQMTLMATYLAYNEMIASGYSEANVKLFVLKEAAEKELNLFKKTYGLLADNYFDSNNRLVTSAYLMLDQIVNLMNKHPGIKLEIEVHTDNQGAPASQLHMTQTRGQAVLNYLVSRGISLDRLSLYALGGSRPITSNISWPDRRNNRRIDFFILNN